VTVAIIPHPLPVPAPGGHGWTIAILAYAAVCLCGLPVAWPRLCAAGRWIRRHWCAYWRDLLGRGEPPPLPQRVRKIAYPPPHCPDGKPLDERELNQWDRIVRNEKTGRTR
jgi:hypothetical protein